MDELLKQLVEFLKTASPQLWSILMKQVYSDAIVNLLFGLLFLTLGIVCGSRILILYKRPKTNDYEDYRIQYIVLGLLSFLFILISFMTLPVAFQHFYNPEFYAIQSIVGSLKGGM
jgi:hypothetical protein